MKAAGIGLVVTGLAAGVFCVAGVAGSEANLRGLGALGGATLAVAGVVLGLVRRSEQPMRAAPLPVVRFFADHRGEPRHDTQLPVRLAINGRSYPATLLNVSASGALLRLRALPNETLHAEIGQPVRIEDYPAGVLSRIGPSGVYVDFAVRFEPAPSLPRLDPETVGAGPTKPLEA